MKKVILIFRIIVCLLVGLTFLWLIWTMNGQPWPEKFTTTRYVPLPFVNLSAEAAVKKWAELEGIDKDLVMAFAHNENIRDAELNFVTSSKGAKCFMQIMPQYHVGKGKTCEVVADTYADLEGKNNRENCARCGVLAVKDCKRQADAAVDVEKLPKEWAYKLAYCYNHSSEYVSNVALTYMGKKLRGQG